MDNFNIDIGEILDVGYDNKYFCDRLYDYCYCCYISRVCVKICKLYFFDKISWKCKTFCNIKFI